MNSRSQIYEGCLDFAGATIIGGWARDPSEPDKPVDVDILVDGQKVATVKANQFRQGLLDAGKGDGRCAFVFQMPPRLRDNKNHSICAKISATDVILPHSPKDVFCPSDLSEPLPRKIIDDALQITLSTRPARSVSDTRYQPSAMKIHIVCYEELGEWVLGKIARKLADSLEEMGMTVGIGKQPDPSADINHHIIYWGYIDKKTTLETIMVTHIDNYRELGKVKQQLVDLNVEMGICMSFEAVNRLAQFGVPRHKLGFVSPAHDGVIRPGKTLVGVTTRVYEDGCKREHLLLELARLISPNDFRFTIMGSGWEHIVAALRKADYEVDYVDHFDLEAYCKLIPSLDFYLYMGLDEGSLGFLDAIAAAVPTIVTPQGFHLDVPGGITYPFHDLEDLERIFSDISGQRLQKANTVSSWTWSENARKHALIWEYLLFKEAGKSLPKEMTDELSELGISV